MTRDTWERQFKHLLKQKLGIGPESIRFHWRQYYNERYTPEGAIADLLQKNELYPQLGILPVTIEAGVVPSHQEKTA
jgi:hypothetical protein